MLDSEESFVVNNSVEALDFLCKDFTWTMFALSETVDGYETIGKVLEEDLDSTVIPIEFEEGVKCWLHLCLLAPDVKAQQMIKGSSVGGMYCCGHCYRHRAYFGDYSLSIKGKLRDWFESTIRYSVTILH